MASLYEQCQASIKEVLGFYDNQKSCPCAFPRFGQLAQFDFRRYGISPVGCHATELAIGLLTGKEGFYQRKGDGGNTGQCACRVCGTELETDWEQFNINMDVMVLRYRKGNAKIIGAAAETLIPMPQGFFGFGRESINHCAKAFSREASFEEMGAYLKSLHAE